MSASIDSASPQSLPPEWDVRPTFGLAAAEVERVGLLEAANKGDLAGVKRALADGARPFARQAGTGMTALHLASAAAFTPAFATSPRTMPARRM